MELDIDVNKINKSSDSRGKLKEIKTINGCSKAGPRSQVPFSEPNDKAEWLYDIEKFMNCPESMTKNWRTGILPMKTRPELTQRYGDK